MKVPNSRLDRAFYLTLTIKAAVGILQLVGGTLLLFLKPEQIDARLRFLTRSPVDHDHDDFIVRGISHYITSLTGGAIRFAALYLIVDAIIKLVLINEIFHKRYWAYIGLICVLSLLIVFQTYHIAIGHSIPLTLLTVFDAVIIYLSAKEYGRHRRPKHKV